MSDKDCFSEEDLNKAFLEGKEQGIIIGKNHSLKLLQDSFDNGFRKGVDDQKLKNAKHSRWVIEESRKELARVRKGAKEYYENRLIVKLFREKFGELDLPKKETVVGGKKNEKNKTRR